VVTFGAFVEILPGVEGLVHISELAQHHVENPREVVSQGQAVDVKIIEIDGERRRLSLSLKRVEPDDPVQPRADGGESVHLHPNLDLSDRADETPEGYDDLEDAEADVEALEAAEEEVGPAVEAPVLAETEAELAEDEPAAADTPDEE
jgi:small subunit ribosomal protein S1